MSHENLLKKLEEFCRENRDRATKASSGTSLSFGLSTSQRAPTPEEVFIKSFLSIKSIEFRRRSRNILKGFSVTNPTSHKDKKMLGMIYHDKKDNGDNEDLFEISPNNIRPLKPSEVKKDYPEYNGYHREDKKYLK